MLANQETSAIGTDGYISSMSSQDSNTKRIRSNETKNKTLLASRTIHINADLTVTSLWTLASVPDQSP